MTLQSREVTSDKMQSRGVAYNIFQSREVTSEVTDDMTIKGDE